uniref:BPI fold containing family B member 2 n=1 Tax=Monodelphis domestica TaxID=13616 RepID=F6T1T6_MONDO
MFLVCALLFLLGMWVPFSEASTPRTEVRINQAALDYVAQVGLNSFQDALKMQLTDFLYYQRGHLQRIPVFMLENDISHLSLKLIPNYGIHLSTSGHVGMTFFLERNLQKLRVGITTEADIVISQAAIGTLVLGISLCNTTIEEVNLTYSEDGSKEIWNSIHGYIKAILPHKPCSKLSFLVEGLNVYMGTLIGLRTIGPESQISYSLTHPPTITKDYISLAIKATFVLLGKPIVFPPPPSSFSLPQQVGSSTAMINFGLSQGLFDSIHFLMQKSGSINLDITGQLNSKNNQLTTSVLGNLIPEVLRQFPNSMPLVLKARVNAEPIVTIHNNQTSLWIQYLLDVLAVSSNSAFKSLFSLDMAVDLALNIFMSGGKLQANASLQKDIEFNVTSSNVGVLDLLGVKPLLRSAVKEPLTEHLNALFGLGVTLPSIAKANFISPQVFVYEGYIVVSCGLHFQD